MLIFSNILSEIEITVQISILHPKNIV